MYGQFSRFVGRISLRRIIRIAFVFQILIPVSFLGWMFFRTSRESVEALSMRLGSEVAARIAEHLQSYMAVPLLVNSLNADALESGRVDIASPRIWQPFFAERIRAFPSIAYTFIGTPRGEFFGARRFKENVELFVASPETTGGASVYYSVDPRGMTGDEIISYPGFDPRTRPWYTAGEHADTPVWSEIYRHFALDDLAITAVQALRGEDGSLVGVLGVDLPLSAINSFLRELKVGAEGQIFILDNDGNIVADSTVDKPFHIRNGAFSRIAGVASPNPAIRAAAERMAREEQGERTGRMFSVENSAGISEYVRTRPFRSLGLDWKIAVVIPEKEFIGSVQRMARSAFLITLAALGLSLLTAFWVSRWICRPLSDLVESAKAITRGEWRAPFVLKRDDEVGELSRSFALMSKQLSEAFSGLEEKVRLRTVELEQKNRELTEAKAVSESLAEEAKAASRAKSSFLASMSHEIRTPMNAVLGLSDLVLATPLSEEQREHLSLVQTSAESLLGILDDILDLAKIEAGKMSLENRPFRLRPLVEQVGALMRPRAEKNGVALGVSVAPELSDAFEGDPLRVRQILMNLVGNAVKFTSEGSVEIVVTLAGGDEEQAQVAFAVSDTGPGIPQSKVHLLFDDFTQLDGSSTRKHGGTGLGLAISRSLARLMGGDITVESEVGRGSVFRFSLPLLRCSGEIVEEHEGTETDFSSMKGNVLLAEDNAVNTKMTVAMLKKTGLTVRHAQNGREAVEMWRSEPFDLILMDCEMPVMDGLEATRRIRSEEQDGKSIPIVALTAYAMKGDRERCLEAGMTEYISKPIRSRKLYSLLARFLGTPSPSLHTDSEETPARFSAENGERERWESGFAELLLSLDGDREALAEMVEAFFSEVPELRGSLRSSLEKGDSSAAARALHKLKGVLGYLMGGEDISLFRVLEIDARTEGLKKDDPRLRELHDLLDRYELFLREAASR